MPVATRLPNGPYWDFWGAWEGPRRTTAAIIFNKILDLIALQNFECCRVLQRSNTFIFHLAYLLPAFSKHSWLLLSLLLGRWSLLGGADTCRSNRNYSDAWTSAECIILLKLPVRHFGDIALIRWPLPLIMKHDKLQQNVSFAEVSCEKSWWHSSGHFLIRWPPLSTCNDARLGGNIFIFRGEAQRGQDALGCQSRSEYTEFHSALILRQRSPDLHSKTERSNFHFPPFQN